MNDKRQWILIRVAVQPYVSLGIFFFFLLKSWTLINFCVLFLFFCTSWAILNRQNFLQITKRKNKEKNSSMRM